LSGRSAAGPKRIRRTWYRRRLRARRALVTAGMVLLLAAVCWQNLARYLPLPTLHASNVLPESFWTRGDVRSKLALMAQRQMVRVSRAGLATYPYSVIPGGVRDAADLQEHAARDYVVRRHFAGFNYKHARLVRSGKNREVYLSYRVREHIYWTRKKVRLLEAELLVTDGAITARARCGNQISETPKAEVSDDEPAADVLDQPVQEIAALGPALPFQFSTVHPNLPGADAIAPGSPQLFAGGFHFPSVDFILPAPHLCKAGEEETNKHCKKHRPHPPAPEPATWLLLASGLAAVGWQYRRVAHKSAVW
jgi:hypothetical protein